MNDVNGLNVTSVTLVGYSKGKYPIKHGNCFSMKADDGYEYRVVNFVYENLEEAIRLGITLPIKLRPLGLRSAIVIDERIPDDWYSDRYCETCCPADLLPHPQRMAHVRQEARGERVIKMYEGSEHIKEPMTMIMTDVSKAPKLGTQDNRRKIQEDWTIEEVIGDGFVYAPYIPKVVNTMSEDGRKELVSMMAEQLQKDIDIENKAKEQDETRNTIQT